jgi:hypothetical protein
MILLAWQTEMGEHQKLFYEMKSTGSLTSRISAAYLLAVIAVLTPFHAFAQADAVPDDSLLDCSTGRKAHRFLWHLD